jgi:hypothetical protein
VHAGLAHAPARHLLAVVPDRAVQRAAAS